MRQFYKKLAINTKLESVLTTYITYKIFHDKGFILNQYSKQNNRVKIGFGKFKYESKTLKIYKSISSDDMVFKNEKSFFQKLFEWLKAIIDVFKKIYSASELFK